MSGPFELLLGDGKKAFTGGGTRCQFEWQRRLLDPLNAVIERHDGRKWVPYEAQPLEPAVAELVLSWRPDDLRLPADLHAAPANHLAEQSPAGRPAGCSAHGSAPRDARAELQLELAPCIRLVEEVQRRLRDGQRVTGRVLLAIAELR